MISLQKGLNVPALVNKVNFKVDDLRFKVQRIETVNSAFVVVVRRENNILLHASDYKSEIDVAIRGRVSRTRGPLLIPASPSINITT